VEFLAEYGMFLAKAVTVLVVVALIIGLAASAGVKDKPSGLKITKLNDKLNKLKSQLQESVLDKTALKSVKKAEKTAAKQQAKAEKNADKKESTTSKKKVFVLDFNGDIKASQGERLKNEISALLTIASPEDEVVVKVESGGGMVHQYGLASSQLDRIKSHNIPLTVCVDKVAASGGYMMAVVADKIVAAPFAILGSIGVVAQVPNFNKLLKKNDIEFEVHTAGEYKRTLTLFGENTDKAREKFQEDLKDVHELFKTFVSEHRPVVDVNTVANGDIWYGQRALDVKLIDEIKTSDQYLQDKCKDCDVFLITTPKKKALGQRLGLAAQTAISRGVEQAVEKLSFQKWYM